MPHNLLIFQLKGINRLFFPVVMQRVLCSEETKFYKFFKKILDFEK